MHHVDPGGKVYIEDIRASTYTTDKGENMAIFVAPLYHGMNSSGHILSLGIAQALLDGDLNHEIDFVEVCSEDVKNSINTTKIPEWTGIRSCNAC